MTARRASHTLDEANRNHLTQILEGLLGDTPVSNELEFCDPDLAGTFIEWLQNAEGPDSPNTEQERFIRRTNYQVSSLQGPPGTGKTGGALASAILTRAYARMADGKHLRGIVTAPSNKAVYEILEDVAEIREAFADSDDETLDDLRIVRATGKDTSDFDHLNGVEYLNYGEEEAKVEELAEALTRQRGLGDFINGQQTPASVLLFVTPSGSYGLMNKVAKAWGEENAQDVLGRMQRHFNFLAVDEASMMPLSQFILCGAFINENAQILVAGDHRQMPPVQKHDWDKEDRRTVEEIAPHLSALDFFRFLKGDLEVEHSDLETTSDLPMTQLELTYRCHKRVAEMLRRWLYEKYDDIEYQSDQTATLADPVTDIEGIQKILDPAHPLILILHNEDMSQQANPTEAAIANAVIRGIDDQDNFGIVTPHNAQRGLLKNEIGTDADIDTVERFQGGQRDLIVVSGTASDPESIRQKTDFILSPNRLNVAMSRMKKKLIIIASRSMFEVIPADAEDYEDALLWRGLYHEVGAGESAPVWEGSLADIIATENNELQNVNIEVYSGS